MGCNGGSGATVTAWIAEHGITTEECLPYVSGSGTVPSYLAKYHNGSDIIHYK